MCLNIDLAPTILDLIGAPIPNYMQGESMKPLLLGAETKWRESFLFEYYVDDAYPYAGPDMLAIRTDRFKLIDNHLKDDIDELYDLKNDPGEMKNLINEISFDSVEQALRQSLDKLKIEYDYNPDRDWWLRQVISK